MAEKCVIERLKSMKVMSKEEIWQTAREQLAIDYNCEIEALEAEGNTVVEAANLPGRRTFKDGLFFFRMVTLGKGAVIQADPAVHDFARAYVKDKKGHWLFELDKLEDFNRELAKHGYKLGPSHHLWLPDSNALMDMPSLLVQKLANVRWFEQEEIPQFYESDLFHNALGYKSARLRPDMLAVAAYDGERIMGMAGVSADSERLWQIGIDVMEEYRGRGLGVFLVKLLKDEVLRRGRIPYYGTSLSNLHSQNIALRCGFRPAWVEINTTDF